MDAFEDGRGLMKKNLKNKVKRGNEEIKEGRRVKRVRRRVRRAREKQERNKTDICL